MGLIISPLGFTTLEQTYSGSITWTGTQAPSSTPTHTYEWSYFYGNLVFLRINLKYATAGTALTAVLMALPSDCPTPVTPTGFQSASANALSISGALMTSITATAIATRAWFRVNANNNGYNIGLFCASNDIQLAEATVIYWSA